MLAKSPWNVVFAMLWLLVAAGVALSGLSTTRLACSRDAGEAAGCIFTRSGLLARKVVLVPGAISAVQVAERAEGKRGSSPRFAVLLLDQQGAETEVARFDSAGLAHALREQLRAFLADRARTNYARETTPSAFSWLLFGGALAIGGGLLLQTPLRARRDRLEAQPAAHGSFDPSLPSPLGPPADASSDGPRVKLYGARPWVLGLAGLCLFAGVGTRLLFAYADRHQGAVEIRAESRCRFNGAELLPGAVMSLHLEPGRYSVEVYNSRVPGNWETQSVDVRVGETTPVRCSPLQR